MELEDVRNIVKNRGVHPGKFFKTKSIESFPAEEAGFDCFAASNAVRPAVCGVKAVLMRL